MKRTSLTLCLIAASALTLLGQGRVNFNNFASGIQAITVVPALGPSPPQPVYAGADFSVQLLWAFGTFNNQASFDGANPSSSSSFAFFGVTGSAPAHGPLVDGAGLFDGGTIPIGPIGVYTMQARGWYNGGIYPTYQSSTGAGLPGGLSGLIQIAATASPTPAPNTAFSSFIIAVPEPSIFTLVSLGTACVLLFRLRKQRGRINSAPTRR